MKHCIHTTTHINNEIIITMIFVFANKINKKKKKEKFKSYIHVYYICSSIDLKNKSNQQELC